MSDKSIRAADFCYWLMAKKSRKEFFGSVNPGVVAFLDFVMTTEQVVHPDTIRGVRTREAHR